MKLLDRNTMFITPDWVMKFLPWKFREAQSYWFGRRGISWHISVALRRSEVGYETMSFVHIFQAQSQDSNAVTAIMHYNVVSRLKHIVPELHTVYFRQDNAASYHCATKLLSVKKITQETEVAIREIDFCDPQGGKRVCDRKAATI